MTHVLLLFRSLAPKKWFLSLLLLGCWLSLLCVPAEAQQLPGLTSQPTGDGGQQWSLSLQTLLFLSSLAFLPAMLLMMTSFTRIIIVLSLLRTAMGTQATPLIRSCWVLRYF